MRSSSSAPRPVSIRPSGRHACSQGASLLALGQPKDGGARAGARVRPDAARAGRAPAARRCLRAHQRRPLPDRRVPHAGRVWRPPMPSTAYRLGKAYLRLSQWAHARIQAIDPQAARLSQALGREYLEQGRPDLAEARVSRCHRPRCHARRCAPGAGAASIWLTADWTMLRGPSPARWRSSRTARTRGRLQAAHRGRARPRDNLSRRQMSHARSPTFRR